MAILAHLKEYLKKSKRSDESVALAEYSVIAGFLQSNGFKAIRGSQAHVLLEKYKDESPLFKGTEISLHEIISCFEMLVPEEEAKQFGAYFTPPAVTRFMSLTLLDRLEQNKKDLRESHILDPAVGCGALLVEVCLQMAERTGEDFSDVAKRMHGTDLSAAGIERASILFELAALALGDDSVPMPSLMQRNGLESHEQVFDGVIANPPYVRQQKMGEALRGDLQASWDSCKEGNFDLYFPFFEHAHELLDENGVAVFITPNGFLSSKSGRCLREWFGNKKNLRDIHDFDKHRVFDVLTYTAVTVFEKNESKSFSYRKVEGIKGLLSIDTKPSQAYRFTGLDSTSWGLTDPDDAKVIEAVASNPIPLLDVFDVRYGMTTLRDSIYTFRGEARNGFYEIEYDGEKFEIEEGIVRKSVKISTVRSENDIPDDDRYAIYPYFLDTGKPVIMPESYLRTKFPKTWEYFNAVKDELALRDHGKKTYPAWYAYGRSQSLEPVRNKLLVPSYLIQPRFMFDESDALFMNGCALIPKPGWSMEQIRKAQEYLNSNAVRDFMLATSKPIDGGYVSYQKTPLSRIKFPQL